MSLSIQPYWLHIAQFFCECMHVSCNVAIHGDDWVQDPYQNIPSHPEYNQLYILDPVASGLSSSELKIMVDLIVENMPTNGYRAIEMCAKPDPLTEESTLSVPPLASEYIIAHAPICSARSQRHDILLLLCCFRCCSLAIMYLLVWVEMVSRPVGSPQEQDGVSLPVPFPLMGCLGHLFVSH